MEWNGNVPGLKEAAMMATKYKSWERVDWKPVGTLLEATLPRYSVAYKQLMEIKQSDELYKNINIVSESCKRGYTELVLVFLNSGIPPNHILRYPAETMLHCATKGGHLPLLKVLLNYGADIHRETFCGESSLFRAVRRGHLDVVKLFISAGADINKCKIDIALSYNNVTEEMLQLVLDLGYNPNTNLCPLYSAVFGNNIKCVKMLLDAGAHVNGTDSYRPLPKAAMLDNISVMQLLLDHGADINIRDRNGYTALHRAVESTNLQSVEFLIERGSLINSVNNYHETPLSLSIVRKLFDIAMLLINSGADLKLHIHDTVLNKALYKGAHIQLIECLLDHGAKVTSLDDNNTALQYVISHITQSNDWKLHVAKLLLIYGSNHYVEDEYGNTVLHWACEMDDVGLVKYLIHYGLNVDAKNREGNKPSDIATEKGHTNIVKAITLYHCKKYTNF